MSAIEYNNLLFEISQRLDELNVLDRLVFLCRGKLSSGSEDNIQNVLSLFKELEEQNNLGIDRVEIIKELLKGFEEWSIYGKVETVEKFESRRKEYNDLLEQIICALHELDDLERLIALCRGKISEESEGHIQDVRSLFKELENQNNLDACYLDILKGILTEIEKDDLVKEVEEFEERRRQEDDSDKRKAQAVAVVSFVGDKLKGVLNMKMVSKLVASGIITFTALDILSRWSTFDQLVTAFNSCVLPAGTNLVQLTDGCVCLTVRSETLSALTALWKLYQDGTLKTRLYNFFVTDEVRDRAGGKEVEVIVTIEEQEYEKACLDLINEAQAKETEDLGRPTSRSRSNSDSNLYCKARDGQFGESKKVPEISLEEEPKYLDPEKEAFVQKYLQNIRDETHSLVAESSDSGIRTHGAPSDFDEMEDVSALSRDAQEGEESRRKDDPRRLRKEDAPSWYDEAVNANYQEEVMQIPKDKARLVIGKKGQTIKDIKELSGVHELFIKDCLLVHLRGTGEQLADARRIIDTILRGEDSTDQGSWKKLDFIPEKYMGRVIGKKREHLNDIEQKTGATLKVFQTNTLYIKGSKESQKRAIRKIKENVYNLMTQSKKRIVRFVYVNTTHLDLGHKFQLTTVQLPDAFNAGETTYRLKPLKYPSQDMEDLPPDFIGKDRLKEKLLTVLKKLHKEKEEERVRIDIWCHLGHAYITEVDEADEDEEYFTLAEIKEKLEDDELGWKSIFKGELEKIEVEHIERHLESRAAKEEIRYDFTFYTPSCRYVRVKVWLSEKDAAREEGKAASMTFSRSAPFDVRTVSTHVLPDDQGDSSHKPCFYMCSQTQQRMTADILMVSKGCDYRLFIKTCPIGHVSKKPKAKEEDNILASYLRGMKINEGQLTLPPLSECPDGFDLFYKRRSLRRIYEYGEQFTLLVSKDQEKTVDPTKSDVNGFNELPIKTDIHLHCTEWDQLLEEGNWEPEQIVAKLPTFLQFLRRVQRCDFEGKPKSHPIKYIQ